MAPVTITPTYTISAGDTELVSVNFTKHLDNGELLTGTPTVTEASGNATLASKQLNSATYVDKSGVTVAASSAVQFSFTSSTAATYTVVIQVSTDATIARTFKRQVLITVQ